MYIYSACAHNVCVREREGASSYLYNNIIIYVPRYTLQPIYRPSLVYNDAVNCGGACGRGKKKKVFSGHVNDPRAECWKKMKTSYEQRAGEEERRRIACVTQGRGQSIMAAVRVLYCCA